MGQTLRVLAKGTAMVPHYGHHALGRRAFVGRTYNEELGQPYEETDERGLRRKLVAGVYVADATPTSLNASDPHVGHAHWMEYLTRVREGDLWAADEETAALSGVKYDPTFGGEYERGQGGSLVNVAHRAAMKALLGLRAPVTPPPTTKSDSTGAA